MRPSYFQYQTYNQQNSFSRRLFLLLLALLRFATPPGTVFLLLLIEIMPVTFLSGDYAAPRLSFSALFFWAMFRPQSIVILLLIPLSLAADLLHYKPLALSMLSWLPMYAIVRNERTTMGLRRSFQIIWAWFLLFLSLSYLISFLGVSAVHGLLLPDYATAISFLLTLLCFPLLYSLLYLLDRLIFGRNL